MSRFDNKAMTEATAAAGFKTATQKSTSVKVELIERNPFQPRSLENEVKVSELVDSIFERGLLQPITIAKWGKGYVVAAGHRRLHAYKMLHASTKEARFEKIPAHIVEADERELMAMSLVENVQREDLLPLELAISIDRALNSGHFQTKQDLARAIGKSPSFISEALNALKISPALRQRVEEDRSDIGVSVLTELQKVDDDQAQVELYEQFVSGEIGRAEIREAVQAPKANDGEKSDATGRNPAELSTAYEFGRVDPENASKLQLKVRIPDPMKRARFVTDLEKLLSKHGFAVGDEAASTGIDTVNPEERDVIALVEFLATGVYVQYGSGMHEELSYAAADKLFRERNGHLLSIFGFTASYSEATHKRAHKAMAYWRAHHKVTQGDGDSWKVEPGRPAK